MQDESTPLFCPHLVDALDKLAADGNERAVATTVRLISARLSRIADETGADETLRPGWLTDLDRRREAARRLPALRPGSGLASHDPNLSEYAA